MRRTSPRPVEPPRRIAGAGATPRTEAVPACVAKGALRSTARGERPCWVRSRPRVDVLAGTLAPFARRPRWWHPGETLAAKTTRRRARSVWPEPSARPLPGGGRRRRRRRRRRRSAPSSGRATERPRWPHTTPGPGRARRIDRGRSRKGDRKAARRALRRLTSKRATNPEGRSPSGGRAVSAGTARRGNGEAHREARTAEGNRT